MAIAEKIAYYKNITSKHDVLDCFCEDCEILCNLILEYKSKLQFIINNITGLPELIDGDNIIYGVNDITPIGDAKSLYHVLEERHDWYLEWENFGNTLVGVYKVGLYKK